MTFDIDHNISLNYETYVACLNCKLPAILEDLKLKDCCGSIELDTPKPKYRYVSLCCQSIIELAPERFDVYKCYTCQKLRIIDDDGLKIANNVIYCARSLTTQETKLILKNRELEDELAIVNEELRLVKNTSRINEVVPVFSSVEARRREILNENVFATTPKRCYAEPRISKLRKDESTSTLGSEKSFTLDKKSLGKPVRNFWRKITGQRKWAPSSSY